MLKKVSLYQKNTFESMARFQKIHICHFSVKSQHETRICEMQQCALVKPRFAGMSIASTKESKDIREPNKVKSI